MATRKTTETHNVYSVDGRPIDTGKQKDTPASEHPSYIDWMGLSELTRTLMMGEYGMKRAGERFLPKFDLENDPNYNARLEMSTLVNAFRKTVGFLGGQVFQSEIRFSDEFPDEIKDETENIDLLNDTVNVFSKRVFQTGIADGPAHILVEAPGNNDAETKAEEKEAGIRPYFKQIRAENLIGWRTDDNDILEQLRIREIVPVKDGKFGEYGRIQMRVLYAGGYEIYVEGEKDKWNLTEEGYTSLNYIPLSSFLPGEPLSLLTCESPLQDLAGLNLHHWRSFSDQTNILHVGRLPILFGKGIDLAAIPVATSKAISTVDSDADMKFVEISGASIAAGRDDIRDTEALMALYGLQQMIPRTGNVTATEKAISAADSNSNLATWVNGYEDCLTEAFRIWGDYIGQEVPTGSVIMPVDFEAFMADATMVKALQDLAASGIISKQAAFEYINKTGVLSDGYTWDRVLEEVEEESRSNGGTLANLGGLFS